MGFAIRGFDPISGIKDNWWDGCIMIYFGYQGRGRHQAVSQVGVGPGIGQSVIRSASESGSHTIVRRHIVERTRM